MAIVGGGVVGCCIARELSRYRLRTVLLEKQIEVGFGTTKTNSGIIHAGQLDENAVALETLALDQRLGDAELVDPVVDGLQPLAHRLVADLPLDVGLEGQGPALRTGGEIVVREVVADHLVERGAIRARRHLDGELQIFRVDLGRAQGDLLVAGETDEPLQSWRNKIDQLIIEIGLRFPGTAQLQTGVLRLDHYGYAARVQVLHQGIGDLIG